MRPVCFDNDHLRSLVAMSDLGGLAPAGALLGRTVAAMSLQMRKLEEQAGSALFYKDGRKLALTGAGATLLSFARRILALNDEARLCLQESDLSGSIRLGTSQDFGDFWLPPILAQFRKLYPAVALEVSIDRSSQLIQEVDRGTLDMVLTMGMGDRASTLRIGQLPLVWIAHRDFEWDTGRPLPLAVFPVPCRFRARANAELDAVNIPWTIALTSTSLYGIWAAVRAKLGVTLRTVQGMQTDLEVVDDKFGLPSLGMVDLSLTIGGQAQTPALRSLVGLLRDSLRQRVVELDGDIQRKATVQSHRAPPRGSPRALASAETKKSLVLSTLR